MYRKKRQELLLQIMMLVVHCEKNNYTVLDMTRVLSDYLLHNMLSYLLDQ